MEHMEETAPDAQTDLLGGSLQTDRHNQRKHPVCAVYGL